LAKNDAPLLRIEALSVSYGPIAALRGITLEIREGELVALIGANGAGKSTLLKAVLGIQRALSGRITYNGRDITQTSVDHIVASGISIVPEGRGVLSEMTIAENLELGAYHRKDGVSEGLEQVFERFPVLRERKDQKAGTLSGGEQQMLVIARSIMANPKLILMDEPSLGLAPIIVNKVFNIIAGLKAQGYTILLAEQNAEKALKCADRGYVFELGEIVLQGTSQELITNARVRVAYLGGSDE
jgi:branched-chain amino acid transport system ATP-binding protein